ncbi:reverse transcriptase family protein [Deefgea tanakiae]|uniref:RNA-directed DNA polymerase n=1 Tax=Deefgea tanakiae TaxID=2865840 RepID=A0ABX8ZBF8_9NEIS|nr:reverse transcriptase domain-containing protein [Deefgea tanakiae]QZA78495.1 reverse transcriptase family protein [Deefgea tanakiae]
MKKPDLESAFNSMFHGKYKFSEFINLNTIDEYTIIQHNNRIVYSTTKKLKDFHKFLNLFVFEYLRINEEVVFSYRKGHNVVDAVKIHAKGKYFYQSDIIDFFSCINEQHIDHSLKISLSSIPVSDIEKYAMQVKNLILIDGKLPIGFSTSPPISNSVLFDFDKIIKQHCTLNDIKYSRYSDDIIFSANSLNLLDDIEKITEETLLKTSGNAFHINTKKSKIKSIGEQVKILGMVIMPNGELTVDSKIKNKTEILLHHYRTDKEKFKKISENELEKSILNLGSLLNYINAVDKPYLYKLKKKYGATTIDFFIHKTRG